MEISVNSFVRNQLVNWFGPEKPKKPADGANSLNISAYTMKKADHTYKVEVFVYNATANIANGAVVTAVIAAAAAIFSVIGPLFALVTIGACVAIHWDAKQALPLIEKEEKNGWAATYKDSKGEKIEQYEVNEIFGLKWNLFVDKDNKEWKQVALNIAGFDLWFNTLPTEPKVQQGNEGAFTGSPYQPLNNDDLSEESGEF